MRDGPSDCAPLTIIFVAFSDSAAATLVQHNKSINNIYQQDTRVGGEPVIDAIPGDGFNPVWQEMQIAFEPGVTPHQFCRDDDVVAAATSNPPQITLTPTGEVYWCPVVGSKK